MLCRKKCKSDSEGKILKVKAILCSFILGLCLVNAVAALPTGKLLVRTYTLTDQDLYIMNEDGSDLRAIETTPEWAAGGDFSPDGKTILYATSIPGYGYNIYQVPLSGGTPRIVQGCAGIRTLTRPCWGNSPDHFYYSTETGGPCGNYDTEIHKLTYTLDSEGLLDELISDEIIVAGKNIWLYDVQEDLNKMTCTTMNPTGYCWSAYIVLAIYDADGTNRYELPPTVDGNADDNPMISPDGRYIIYGKANGASDPSNIYRIRLDGTDEQKLTNYSSSRPNHPQCPIWGDDDNIFYGLASTSSSKDFVLHQYTISTGMDVVIPCGLPNCMPVDFFTINEPTLVAINIKPESCPNPLNVKSKRMLPVAVLGSDDFDVFNIDPASIRLEGIAPIRSSYEDVATPVSNEMDDCDCTTEGPDGYLDLMLNFDAQEIVAALGSIYNGDELLLTLTGEDLAGTPIEGTDCVLIVAKNVK
jgi:hypothetical protein